MESPAVVGTLLVAGFVVFMVGAAAWRLEYERPHQESLPLIHRDRRRRTWIHSWMIAALLLTPAGLAALAAGWREAAPAVLTSAATAIYLVGAVCFVVSLTFRLTVVPWAAERVVDDGSVPEAFAPLDRWAGSLYVVHMLSAYAASALVGAAVLSSTTLPSWLGWFGVVWGCAFAAGFWATRFAGFFNPPIWAHLFTGLTGVVILVS